MILAAIKNGMRKDMRAFAKAISWRVVGAIDTFLISFFLSGHFGLASSIVGVEVFTKVALYFAHEKAWDGVR